MSPRSGLAPHEPSKVRINRQRVNKTVEKVGDLDVRKSDNGLVENNIRRGAVLSIDASCKRICTDLAGVDAENTPLSLTIGMRDTNVETIRSHEGTLVKTRARARHRNRRARVIDTHRVRKHVELFLLGEDNILLSIHLCGRVFGMNYLTLEIPRAEAMASCLGLKSEKVKPKPKGEAGWRV